MHSADPFELDEPTARAQPAPDLPKMPEPLPVRLIAVEDVRLPAIAGLEPEMDDFYVSLLEMVKVIDWPGLAYRADNFRVLFDLHERPPERDAYRPLVVELPLLAAVERTLIDREIEYTRQRALTPGCESLLTSDPSGNAVEIIERREVS
jgi:hypothetical protein